MDFIKTIILEFRGMLAQWSRHLAARFRTLRFQVLGIVVLSVLTPSFFAGWLASARISDILRQQVFMEIESRAERIAENISDWIEKRANDVRDFAQTSILLQDEVKALTGEITHEDRAESVRNINRYLTYLLEDDKHFDAINIVSAEGKVLAAYPPDRPHIFPDGDTVNMDAFSPVMEVISDGGSTLAIAQPMLLKGERGSAYFIARFKENLLAETIRNMSPPETAVYILDGDGYIKFSNSDLPPNSTAPAGALALLGNEATHSVYTGVEGEEVIAKVVGLTFLRWGIAMETSRKDAFKPLVIFRIQMILMALALALILLIPAILLARTIVLPLEELSRVSRNIRTGQPGLQVKSSIKGELGEFISTFNSMSTSLAGSLEEINTINEQLRVMSITDSLTGRYNRRYGKDFLTRELQLVSRTRNHLTIVMLDLDNFKKYNDMYGHIAGDEALKQLGDILVGSVRKHDVVIRYGGEEWLICFSQTDKAAGLNIAEKLRVAVAGNIFHLKGENTRITVSIGIATAPEDGKTYEKLIDSADSAMYVAKEAGRNCVRAFSEPDLSGSTPSDPK